MIRSQSRGIIQSAIQKTALFLLCLMIVPFNVFAYQNVKVQGRQLVADFDQNGTYTPFTIQGVGYSPMPITRHVSDWGWPDVADPRKDNILEDTQILDRDFTLLRAMKANTIRIWKANDGQQGTRYPIKMTQVTLDKAKEYNIKVIPGFWMANEGFWQCGSGGPFFTRTVDYTNPTLRADILSKFAQFVTTFKDHPSILFWAIGNENNYGFGNDPVYIKAFYSLVNEMAEVAHQIEGSNYHPVAFVNGDLGYLGNAIYGTTDTQMNHLDIWGSNVYRGISFGTLFSDYSNLSSKPLWISEYGIDAWHTNNVNNPDDGFEDQAAQATYAGKLWDEIVANNNVVVGGTIMEYSDEWWKPYEWLCGTGSDTCNASQNHFGFGPVDNSCPKDGTLDFTPPFPDKFFNEEWWGIVSIAKNPQQYGHDIATPRQVYYTLQSKFIAANNPPVLNPIDNKTAVEEQTIGFQVVAQDFEGSQLTLTAQLADGSSLSTIGASFTDLGNGTGNFSWKVKAPATGSTLSLRFKAMDTSNLSDEKVVVITVKKLARLQSPAIGSIINTANVDFQWSTSADANAYSLWLGNQVGGSDVFAVSSVTNSSVTVTDIPLTGQPLYVRLWTRQGIVWYYIDYIFNRGGSQPNQSVEMTSPVNGALLTNSTVNFQWKAGTAVTQYWLQIGSRSGLNDIYAQDQGTNLSATVSGIPINGNSIYVRLWFKKNNIWNGLDYSYLTQAPLTSSASLILPASGTTITNSTVTFQWNTGSGVSQYWLFIGNVIGANNFYNQDQAVNTSVVVNNIPLQGQPIYVRLWSKIGGNWQSKDYTFQTQNQAASPTPAEMISPVGGTTINSATINFQWNTGNGVSEYALWVGKKQGDRDVYGQTLGLANSAAVNTIPLTGNNVYVRLWSRIGIQWFYKDYVYLTTN